MSSFLVNIITDKVSEDTSVRVGSMEFIANAEVVVDGVTLELPELILSFLDETTHKPTVRCRMFPSDEFMDQVELAGLGMYEQEGYSVVGSHIDELMDGVAYKMVKHLKTNMPTGAELEINPEDMHPLYSKGLAAAFIRPYVYPSENGVRLATLKRIVSHVSNFFELVNVRYASNSFISLEVMSEQWGDDVQPRIIWATPEAWQETVNTYHISPTHYPRNEYINQIMLEEEGLQGWGSVDTAAMLKACQEAGFDDDLNAFTLERRISKMKHDDVSLAANLQIAKQRYGLG
jgi:hypothetical protein